MQDDGQRQYMNKYHIRFNHQHNGSGKVWRVFENGNEHLLEHLDVRVPLRDDVTVENGVEKWNVYCEGYLTITNETAIIRDRSMKEKFKQTYMKTAQTFAELSHAQRLKVGCIIVKDDRIISIGYNGMPAGWSNICEDTSEDGSLKTKPEVLHAESNAIAKLAKSNESGHGASLFVTHSPCLECAKLIYQSGITEVYYQDEYRETTGIEFLRKSKILIQKLSRDTSD
jgi:dCMP deaminase